MFAWRRAARLSLSSLARIETSDSGLKRHLNVITTTEDPAQPTRNPDHNVATLTKKNLNDKDGEAEIFFPGG